MGKKMPYTPNSRIRQTLRQLWLRSRERASAMKAQGYTCQRCGVKQSRAKGKEVYVEAHHKQGIDWEGIFEFIRERVLQTPDKIEVVCKPCHDKHHKEEA